MQPNVTKIGVTGTRFGMTYEQILALKSILEQASVEGAEFHHGDCVGVDVEAAIMAAELGFKTVCHPPIKDELRAFHASDEMRPPLSYFARNRNIANETNLLIVIPFQDAPQNHGGTWYTHSYAKKKGYETIIIYPDGRIE